MHSRIVRNQLRTKHSTHISIDTLSTLPPAPAPLVIPLHHIKVLLAPVPVQEVEARLVHAVGHQVQVLHGEPLGLIGVGQHVPLLQQDTVRGEPTAEGVCVAIVPRQKDRRLKLIETIVIVQDLH